MDPDDDLRAYAAKPSRLVLGLMSGMSVDGLDLALVQLQGSEDHVDVVLRAHASYPYGAAEIEAIRAAQDGGAAEIARLDFDLAHTWGASVLRFLEEAQVDPAEVDLLASHGQTIFHEPRSGDRSAYTLQVGRGDVLAQVTGIRTVSDFRPRDIAAGGEGAPLIPMADWILFGGSGATVACQNLGSIANVTVLPERFEDICAFDTGPANTLIDSFARMGGQPCDLDGALSATGGVDDDVLLTLYTLRAAWLAQPPPKSAGYATFGPALAEEVRARHPAVALPDLVRSAVAFTAGTLVEAYERFVCTRFPDLRTVHFSGGGCHNPTLMADIEARFERVGLQVQVLEPAWVDAKEAVGFALLGDRSARGLPGNVPAATGARAGVVLGLIAAGAPQPPTIRVGAQIIRETRVEDAPAVARLHVRAWRAAYRGILPDARLDALDVQDSTEQHRARLLRPRRPGSRSWVLEESGRIQGWAVTGPCRDEDLPAAAQELYAIYLLPEVVGTGRGRRLMDFCLEDVRGRGASELVMWVLCANERAQRFYRAAGFRPDERVPAQSFEDTGVQKQRLVRAL